MKKWISAFIFILLIFVGVFYFRMPIAKPASDKVLSTTQAPSPTPRVWKQSTVVEFDNASIRISWAIVQPKDLELYSNLKEQKLSEEIKVNKSCSTLVNGGFYSKENTHLGLFTSNFETISQSIQSELLNGFLWITSDDKPMISYYAPNITPRLGLQSGPMLMQNNIPLTLTIKDDDSNRRIVAGTTNNNQLYFFVFYRNGSEFQGPLLGQLPEILDLFAKQNNIDIINAINLDGGSASVFISQYDLLREMSHIGSYFCARDKSKIISQ